MGMEDGCTYSRRRARTCKPYQKRRSPTDTEGVTKAEARHRGSQDVAIKRDVRETMVTLMMSVTQQQSIAMRDCDAEENFDALVSEDNVGNTWEGDDLPKACTFWAWTILAYLHGFVGDMETFHEYLALSDSFVHDSARGSRDSLPVGFPEVVKHGETIKLFTGTAEAEEVESLLAQEVSFPGACEVATEAHICRYIMQYHRAIEISIQQLVRTTDDTAYVGADDARHTDDGAAKGSNFGDRVGGICSLARLPHGGELICDVVEGIQLQFPGFAHLEDAVERTLFFDKTVSGDTKGALERLERCVEVFEGFPGLTRFAMGDGGLYDRLRNACNLTRPPGSLAFPPLEEWQGISAFCDNVPCRSIEALFARRKADLPPTAPLEDIKVLRPESLQSIGNVKEYQASSTSPSALRTPSAIETFLAVVGEAPQGCDGAMDTLFEEDVLLAEGSTSPSLVNSRLEAVGDAAEDPTCSDEGVWPAEAEEVLPSHAIDEDAQDHVIAAEDWFDVIHAMLASSDANNGTCG
ncbi:expressed unknown protein [Ectocarpus siliculosus]|uniref:Uncharacterized protein n=1 Tax=Ectocarpus siliculosus TaxID=2880 RepID=D7FMS1_ECTSI|nr:expressed unknown protein [Ectocarpus siliculosus]|eukprot:CBJ29986.1 expressed unknown protein [Ectocarpus siliculosus]